MNRVHQPRPLVFHGLNVWMGTAAGADELVEVPYREFRPGPNRPSPAAAPVGSSRREKGAQRLLGYLAREKQTTPLGLP